MLRDLVVRYFPNSLSCLQWSKDACLAVVIGEQVSIFVPKFEALAGERVPANFYACCADLRKILGNTFDDDMPDNPRKIYSIGEEQGPGYALKASWSPLGTSRFRKCMLTVLTTNNQAWIFSPVDEPMTEWEPRYELASMMAEWDGWGPMELFETVWRSRAKEIAWSPACTRWSALRWGDSLLAVANEHMEIVLFRVNWEKAEIVSALNPFPDQFPEEYPSRRLKHVHHIAWSPWVRVRSGEDVFSSYLAYVAHGKVYMSKVTLRQNGTSPTPLVEVDEGSACLGGSISEVHPVYDVQWIPEVTDGRISLVYAVQKRVTVVVVDGRNSALKMIDFPNTFTEAVSGFTLAPSTQNHIKVQVVTSRGRAQIIDVDMTDAYLAPSEPRKSQSIVVPLTDSELPNLANATEEQYAAKAAEWSSVVMDRTQDFIGEADLQSALVRIYGLATSPLGGVSSAAASWHPADNLEYITAQKERTQLAFGLTGSPDVPDPGLILSWSEYTLAPQAGFVPTPITMTTEAFLLEARALGNEHISGLNSMLSAINPPELSQQLGEINVSPDRPELSIFRNMYNNAILNIRRYQAGLEYLAQQSSADKKSLPPGDNSDVLAHAVVNVLRLPREASKTCFLSKRILYSFATIGVLGFSSFPLVLELAKKAYNWLDSCTPPTINFKAELDLAARPDVPPQRLTSKLERCPLCQEGMIMADLRNVECAKGHRFVRCAITYLPIVGRWKSRHCGICGRTAVAMGLLEEEGRTDVTGAEVQGGDAEMVQGWTVAEMVFTAWDLCLHCGGRHWASERERERENGTMKRGEHWMGGSDVNGGEQEAAGV